MLTFAKTPAAFENFDSSKVQMNSVKLSYFENSSGYDKVLATSYIIIDCYDALTNVAILEAMRYKTPIFARTLPAHVDYLGEGYPVCFDGVKVLNKLLLTAKQGDCHQTLPASTGQPGVRQGENSQYPYSLTLAQRIDASFPTHFWRSTRYH